MNRKLSSFDIYVIVSELQCLVGTNIEKIYQLTRNDFLLRLKNIETKEKHALYIRNGGFLCTTEKNIETPQTPSTFAMTLRKYLQQGIIASITQHEFDRIITICIEKKEGAYALIIEFFSEGNIILADPEGTIILPLIKQTWAHRSIKSRESYLPPPSQINPFTLSKKEFIEKIKESSTDIVRTLAVTINLSGAIAEEICTRAGIDKQRKINGLSEKAIAKIFDELSVFLHLFQRKAFRPVLVKKEGKTIDVLPFPFTSYTDVEYDHIPRVVDGLARFIDRKLIERKKEGKTEKLRGKLQRQLRQQQEAITLLKEEIVTKKQEGDLIYLHYQEIEALLAEITAVLEKKEKEAEIATINEYSFVKVFNPTENQLIVLLKDTSGTIHDVRLSFRKTVAENAEQAYAKNKKLRSKLHGAQQSLAKTKKQVTDVERQMQQEQQKEERTPSVQKERQFWFERYRWFLSSGGNVVIGGKDAKTNDLIVKKYLKEGDRYAHADVQGAPSVIIKSKGVNDDARPISAKTLEEACMFAASYSKAWKQFAEAQAYWVLPEQVSKTPQSGEFVPKGGFIIRGKRNYCRCTLKLAAGEVDVGGYQKIMVGPVSAVTARTKQYIVLQPGGTAKHELAKTLANAFGVSVETLDRLLPAGGATIVKTAGVTV
ncbi:MAG: NFACT family protein [Candidatus Thermoplasmatota archaeon]|nr:NFACT family protein [Candidatus Thermoplasmatota archaeon]